MAISQLSKKRAATTGIVTLSIGAFATKLTAADARDWLTVATDFLPFLLVIACVALVWLWIQDIRAAHGNCEEEIANLRRLVYPLIRVHTRAEDDIPDEDEFTRGKIDYDMLKRTVARRCQSAHRAPKPKPRRRRSDREENG